MRVLVTGASGLLGRAVVAAFKSTEHEVTGTAFTRSGDGLVKIDLRDKEALEALVTDLKPDVVLHCAAERRPDVAEKNPDAVQKLNVDLTLHLSTLSRSPTHPFFLIYISTDYVFDGHAPPKGYEPGDRVGPTNLYGRTKEEGEREIVNGIELGGRGTVLRVPVLYGEAETPSESAVNILLELTQKAASGAGVVHMDDWAIRYPTNVSDVAHVLVSLANLSATSTPIPPILHFSAQEPMTKYDICVSLAALHDPALVIPEGGLVSVKEGPKPGETIRPKDCHLSNAELEKLGAETGAIKFLEWWGKSVRK